jgi:AbrB family looped-hinge helix DNA binding protein
MRITSKGQVTIPQRIREQAGLLPDTEVEFEIVRGRVVLRPLGKRTSRGARAVARLRGTLKHLKRSTDELMALTRGEG